MEAQRNCINHPEYNRAENHADCLNGDFALGEERAADKKRRKGNRYHTSADININGFLRLRKQAARKPRERICNAEPDDSSKRRVD